MSTDVTVLDAYKKNGSMSRAQLVTNGLIWRTYALNNLCNSELLKNNIRFMIDNISAKQKYWTPCDDIADEARNCYAWSHTPIIDVCTLPNSGEGGGGTWYFFLAIAVCS